MNRLFTLVVLLTISCVSNSASNPQMTYDSAIATQTAVHFTDQAPSWSFAAETLYVKAANDKFNFANTQEINSPDLGGQQPVPGVTRFQFRTHRMSEDFHFGMQLDLRHDFANESKFAKLVYTRIHSNDSEHNRRITAGNNYMAGPGILTNVLPLSPNPVNSNLIIARIFSGNSQSSWTNVRGKSENDYDAIDLMFGHVLDYGSKVSLSAMGGVRYAYLDLEETARYVSDIFIIDGPLQTVGKLHLRSHSHLFGPRGAMDAIIRLGKGYSVVGSIGAAVLAGDIEHSYKYRQTAEDGAGGFDDDLTYRLFANKSDHTHVVAEIDSKLGFQYATSISENVDGNIEIGYKATNYFDVKNNSLLSYVDTTSHLNDFAMYGPYLRAEVTVF